MKDLEFILNELTAAQRAGVFQETPQPLMASSVTRSESLRSFLVSPKWAIAAALLIAACVWTFMFRTNLSDVRNRSRMATMARVVDLQSALATCVGGPSSSLRGSCGQVDFDGDGDVDLSDVSTYQRDLVASSH